MPVKSIPEMNKQMKININEASGISVKCKRRLMKLVEKYFAVNLPKEDFLNIDIEILENGNIKMRGEEYPTTNKISSLEELIGIYEEFQKEVDDLLDKKGTSFETIKSKNEKNNLIAVFFITFVIVVIVLYSIRELILGDLFGVLWLVIIVGCYILPSTGNSIRNRYAKAWRYLKSKFKK